MALVLLFALANCRVAFHQDEIIIITFSHLHAAVYSPSQRKILYEIKVTRARQDLADTFEELYIWSQNQILEEFKQKGPKADVDNETLVGDEKYSFGLNN
jgi:hypothetical protein